MENPKVALVDGDIIRYQLGAVLSKGGTITIQGNKIDVPVSEDIVRQRITEFFDAIATNTGCNTIRIYLSEGHNFRFARATIQPYKGNRKGLVKPYHYKTISNILYEKYTPVVCEKFEADDHLAADQDAVGGTTVICSRDKDLRIRAGWHYSWSAGTRNPEKPLYWIPEIEGKRWFYTQLLTGDSTDNIIGCGAKEPTRSGKLRRKGVGAGAAQKLLELEDTVEGMFRVVVGQYKKKFGSIWRAHMVENGTLLWMSDKLTPWEELEEVRDLFKEYDE